MMSHKAGFKSLFIGFFLPRCGATFNEDAGGAGAFADARAAISRLNKALRSPGRTAAATFQSYLQGENLTDAVMVHFG